MHITIFAINPPKSTVHERRKNNIIIDHRCLFRRLIKRTSVAFSETINSAIYESRNGTNFYSALRNLIALSKCARSIISDTRIDANSDLSREKNPGLERPPGQKARNINRVIVVVNQNNGPACRIRYQLAATIRGRGKRNNNRVTHIGAPLFFRFLFFGNCKALDGLFVCFIERRVN